jgi:hypothetical protein
LYSENVFEILKSTGKQKVLEKVIFGSKLIFGFAILCHTPLPQNTINITFSGRIDRKQLRPQLSE